MANDRCICNEVTLTILADNLAEPPCTSEHGFSVLVESDGRRLLYDVGRGSLFANAAACGISLAGITDLVLSHGHYDHTDALPAVLDALPSVRVHASAHIRDEHYSKRTGQCRSIGLSPQSRSVLDSLDSGRLFLYGSGTSDVFVMDGCCGLAFDIPRCAPEEQPSPLLFADMDCSISDEMNDELSVWIDTPAGLVILVGCCHAGLENTCEHVRILSGGRPLHAVIGGFHLAGTRPARMDATINYLRSQNLDHLVCCHCTGDAETDMLSFALGSAVKRGKCGMQIRL